jgi:hypothetical protein
MLKILCGSEQINTLRSIVVHPRPFLSIVLLFFRTLASGRLFLQQIWTLVLSFIMHLRRFGSSLQSHFAAAAPRPFFYLSSIHTHTLSWTLAASRQRNDALTVRGAYIHTHSPPVSLRALPWISSVLPIPNVFLLVQLPLCPIITPFI